MPGHVAKSEGPDPCPDQWLYVSDELKVIILSVFKPKIICSINQRGLNRWSNNSEQKLGFLSKVKIKKNAFNKK